MKAILSIILRRDYFKDYWTVRGTVKIKPRGEGKAWKRTRRRKREGLRKDED
jgi:hypothetical protein